MNIGKMEGKGESDNSLDKDVDDADIADFLQGTLLKRIQ